MTCSVKNLKCSHSKVRNISTEGVPLVIIPRVDA